MLPPENSDLIYKTWNSLNISKASVTYWVIWDISWTLLACKDYAINVVVRRR